MKMRAYELTVQNSDAEQRVKKALYIADGQPLLTTWEKDGQMRIFCVAKSSSSFPEILDSLGGVIALKDITEQLEKSQYQP